ncbi:unnamed protein product [Nippostrongylus brasiliensis]|uniref:G protein-coupled receptor n=1 Tax=Nippostrongylus brasiliensis TaxID=27835 RepID=A0A158R3I6_NIPBR|nr:unnamed protein product [Nippostrongylus brasiliensis]
MFYFPELYFMNSFITLYTYIAWNITIFIYIMYTDAVYLEMKHFNENLEELDGTTSDLETTLLIQMEMYGRISDAIRELDRIFRLYAFIMLAIIIPSVILTLMMLNQRIHGFKDLMICLPSIALSAYSFLAITIAPARLHDEVNRSRVCLIRNASIWFPYRKKVFIISQTFSWHMEQYDLGISIWGFAILSRPLILGTFSVMAMVLSVIIELTPRPPPLIEVINCTSVADTASLRS